MEIESSSKKNHFAGKGVISHLKEARQKGDAASEEIHGTELSGLFAAALDAAREGAMVLFFLSLTLLFLDIPWKDFFLLLVSFGASYAIWKMGRSALLGYQRLERLHRLIEEEKKEVVENRDQEKEELMAMYEQKGFHGELLERVVGVLMADENRFLQIMLEEELGLRMERYEHPLRQAVAAGIGSCFTWATALLALFFGGMQAMCVVLVGIFCIATFLWARKEGNEILPFLVWSIAVAMLAIGLFFLLMHKGDFLSFFNGKSFF